MGKIFLLFLCLFVCFSVLSSLSDNSYQTPETYFFLSHFGTRPPWFQGICALKTPSLPSPSNLSLPFFRRGRISACLIERPTKLLKVDQFFPHDALEFDRPSVKSYDTHRWFQSTPTRDVAIFIFGGDDDGTNAHACACLSASKPSLVSLMDLAVSSLALCCPHQKRSYRFLASNPQMDCVLTDYNFYFHLCGFFFF